ncbi:MAG: hypothetical protein DRP01_10980 [Archaeoglobales archaeon]|nr:MAG: hypothetical protein DRP01_10980 [Archaeoglobales archaeon]
MRSKGLIEVFGLLVILLSVLGVAYAHWSATLYISGTVETGTVDAEFGYVQSNDDGCGDVSETGDPYECGTWSYVVEEEKEKWYWEGGRYVKDVGSCTVELSEDRKTLIVTLDNAYPSYMPSIAYQIVNTGTIPVRIEKIILTRVGGNYPKKELTPCTRYYVDYETGTVAETLFAEADFSIHVTGIYIGQQIDPKDYAIGDLCIHVLGNAKQNAKYTFTITIVVTQWNKVPPPS